jgi:hypothetical protein
VTLTQESQTYVAHQSGGAVGGHYGFAYLATALLVYAPFSWLYTALGFARFPLVGWQGQVGQQLGLVYPDAFYFLTLMKIPVISSDCAFTWMNYYLSVPLGNAEVALQDQVALPGGLALG